MKIQQRINHQRLKHIIDSYRLMGDEADAFDAYVKELSSQYPHGLLELALVETLAKSWLSIPMKKGVAFLSAAHNRLKQWQLDQKTLDAADIGLTPSQFSQITGLDPQVAFAALKVPALPTQSAVE